MLAVIRACGTEAILAVSNLSPLPQHIRLDLRRWRGASVRDQVAGRLFPNVSGDAWALTLLPHEYFWLELYH